MTFPLNRLTLVALAAFSAISTDLYLSGIPFFVAEFDSTEADGQLTLAIIMCVMMAVSAVTFLTLLRTKID